MRTRLPCLMPPQKSKSNREEGKWLHGVAGLDQAGAGWSRLELARAGGSRGSRQEQEGAGGSRLEQLQSWAAAAAWLLAGGCGLAGSVIGRSVAAARWVLAGSPDE